MRRIVASSDLGDRNNILLRSIKFLTQSIVPNTLALKTFFSIAAAIERTEDGGLVKSRPLQHGGCDSVDYWMGYFVPDVFGSINLSTVVHDRKGVSISTTVAYLPLPKHKLFVIYGTVVDLVLASQWNILLLTFAQTIVCDLANATSYPSIQIASVFKFWRSREMNLLYSCFVMFTGAVMARKEYKFSHIGVVVGGNGKKSYAWLECSLGDEVVFNRRFQAPRSDLEVNIFGGGSEIFDSRIFSMKAPEFGNVVAKHKANCNGRLQKWLQGGSRPVFSVAYRCTEQEVDERFADKL